MGNSKDFCLVLPSSSHYVNLFLVQTESVGLLKKTMNHKNPFFQVVFFIQILLLLLNLLPRRGLIWTIKLIRDHWDTLSGQDHSPLGFYPNVYLRAPCYMLLCDGDVRYLIVFPIRLHIWPISRIETGDVTLFQIISLQHMLLLLRKTFDDKTSENMSQAIWGLLPRVLLSSWEEVAALASAGRSPSPKLFKIVWSLLSRK